MELSEMRPRISSWRTMCASYENTANSVPIESGNFIGLSKSILLPMNEFDSGILRFSAEHHSLELYFLA